MVKRTSEPKVLARTVTVTNPATRQLVSFTKGDVLPEWAEPLVTNPRAFASDGPTSTSSGTAGQVSGGEGEQVDTVDTVDTGQPPSREG